MNDAEIINLIETKGTLPALKYIKDLNKEWSLTDCKRYVDKVIDNKRKSTGTITWYNINIIPVIPENKKGIWLLCYYGQNAVTDSNYYWKATNSFTGDKKPSHWAYINEPKTN